MTDPSDVDHGWEIVLIEQKQSAKIFGPISAWNQARKVTVKRSSCLEKREMTVKAHLGCQIIAEFKKNRAVKRAVEIDHRNVRVRSAHFDQ
jgi:hypothetical protein